MNTQPTKGERAKRFDFEAFDLLISTALDEVTISAAEPDAEEELPQDL